MQKWAKLSYCGLLVCRFRPGCRWRVTVDLGLHEHCKLDAQFLLSRLITYEPNWTELTRFNWSSELRSNIPLNRKGSFWKRELTGQFAVQFSSDEMRWDEGMWVMCDATGPGEPDPALPGAAAKPDVPVGRGDGAAVRQRLSNIPVSPTVPAESREHHRTNGHGVRTNRRHS